VIAGYTPSANNLDAIIFGYYDGRKLIYAGRTRNGFTPSREKLFQRFKRLGVDTCPLANLPELKAGRWGLGLTAEKMKECQWLKPVLVGQFEFVEWWRRISWLATPPSPRAESPKGSTRQARCAPRSGNAATKFFGYQDRRYLYHYQIMLAALFLNRRRRSPEARRAALSHSGSLTGSWAAIRLTRARLKASATTSRTAASTASSSLPRRRFPEQ